jgi:hypothetical protein
MNPEQSGIKAWQWIVTAIVIVALIVIGIMVFGNKKSDTNIVDNTSPIINDSTNTGTLEVNRIIVTDQYPGNVIYISSLNLSKPGWVVVHADKAGKPGDVIGSMYFDKGLTAGSKITLSKSTVEGGIYYAVLHMDDGDKKFDSVKDMHLKDAKGSIIMRLFRATSAVEAGIKG